MIKGSDNKYIPNQHVTYFMETVAVVNLLFFFKTWYDPNILYISYFLKISISLVIMTSSHLQMTNNSAQSILRLKKNTHFI